MRMEENINEKKEVTWQKLLKKDNFEYLPKSHCMTTLLKPIVNYPLSLYVKVNVEGKEYTNPNKPVIFIGNHQSFLDVFVLAKSLEADILKNTFFLAKVNYFKNPCMKSFAQNANIILVDANKNLSETLQSVATALRNGRNMIIFPEGTRTKTGKMGRFKRTYAMIAKELGVDVVPFAIKGAFELYPPHKKFPKSGEVTIKYFKPVSSKDLTVDQLVKENTKVIKDWLEPAIK